MLSFSCPVMSNSPWPHGGSRPDLCPSPSSEVCSSSYLLPWWFHPAVSSYAILFFCPQSFPASETFPMRQLFISWPKYWSVSLSISPSNKYSGLIPLKIDWFDFLAVQGLSGVFSSTTVQVHQFFGTQFSLLSNSHIHIWLLEKP